MRKGIKNLHDTSKTVTRVLPTTPLQPILLLLFAASSFSLLSTEQRAQCACTTNGESGGTEVLYWAEKHKMYSSENIKTGGSYKFIGCGAHKFYHDTEPPPWGVDQVAGYPYTLCFTYGGTACDSIYVPTTQKFTLNNEITYRKNCGGDYDCNASPNKVVSVGTHIGTKVLDEFDGNGNLQDWTNCCKECRLFDGCVHWAFSITDMNCNFYSDVAYYTTNTSSPPVYFTGTVGYDDQPVDCVTRNIYDTCELQPLINTTYGFIWVIIGVILSMLNLVYCDAWVACIRHPDSAVLCKTNDTRILPHTTERKSSKDKHGNVHYYIETTYHMEILYKYEGLMESQRFSNTQENCLPGSDFTFMYLIVNPKRSLGDKIIYCSSVSTCAPPNCCASWKFFVSCCLCGFSMSGVISLIILSCWLAFYDGSKFISKYYLHYVHNPYSTEAWIAAIFGFIMIGFLLLYYWYWENYLIKHYVLSKLEPENTHDVGDDGLQLIDQK